MTFSTSNLRIGEGEYEDLKKYSHKAQKLSIPQRSQLKQREEYTIGRLEKAFQVDNCET